ncbi:hypothetical protein BDN72DRAFT_832426 [Pluteus cervinus]|uniref:Uncharacterized protein n=1 Tax=Pluteus cervinus TaxID=181527 RepID=A0ACD3BB11_9AGAR|nr:hypothetical protein BDN72DRAFT_832426 [Pluteus cervinus]
MSNVLRLMTLNARRAVVASSTPRNPIILQRASFHSPFAALGSSPLTSSSSTVHASVYEKQVDQAPEPFSSQSGARVHVVSEQPSPKFYGIPSGAYPTSLPFGDATSTQASSTAETRKPATH